MAYPDDLTLTSRTTLKASIDPPITGSTADTLIDGLISSASAVIMAAIGIDTWFGVGADRTEKRNGSGSDRISTKVYPITSVTSVVIGGVTIPASADGVAAGYVFDTDTIYLIGSKFTRGVQNVVITYRAGIAAASAEQVALERACIATCALWWKRRSVVGVEVQGINGVSFTNFSAKDLPAEAWTVIEQFKRVTLCI